METKKRDGYVTPRKMKVVLDIIFKEYQYGQFTYKNVLDVVRKNDGDLADPMIFYRLIYGGVIAKFGKFYQISRMINTIDVVRANNKAKEVIKQKRKKNKNSTPTKKTEFNYKLIDSVFRETLNEMYSEFSSVTFFGVLREKGIDERIIHNKARKFLLVFCNPNGGKKTWIKKDLLTSEKNEKNMKNECLAKHPEAVDFSSLPMPIKPTQMTIEDNTDKMEQEAINLLKKLGYKIMKPIHNFEEV